MTKLVERGSPPSVRARRQEAQFRERDAVSQLNESMRQKRQCRAADAHAREQLEGVDEIQADANAQDKLEDDDEETIADTNTQDDLESRDDEPGN